MTYPDELPTDREILLGIIQRVEDLTQRLGNASFGSPPAGTQIVQASTPMHRWAYLMGSEVFVPGGLEVRVGFSNDEFNRNTATVGLRIRQPPASGAP